MSDIDRFMQQTFMPSKPDVVLWCAGWRNAWYAEHWHKDGFPAVDQLATWIEDGVSRMREGGAIVVLMTGPRAVPGDQASGKNAHLLKLAEAMRLVARRSDVVLVDYLAAQQAQIDQKVEMIEEEGRLSADAHRLFVNMACTGLGEAVGKVPFAIDLPGGGFEKGGSIAIGLRRCRDPEAIEIRYTIDGELPDKRAKLYRKPFRLSKAATVNVLATDKERDISLRASAEYVPMRARKADRLIRAHVGLVYAVYQLLERPQGMPDLSNKEAVAEGVWNNLDFDFAVENPDVPDLQENVAIIWRGSLIAPADGVYTLYLRSDDGSQLLMDDEVVVDHDGNHGMNDLAKGMIALDAGAHEFTLRYYQGNGGMGIEMHWEGPGFNMQRVPQTALCYSDNDVPKPKKR